jgi:FkbM family methyltransferase
MNTNRPRPGLLPRLAHAWRQGVLCERILGRLTRKPLSAIDPIVSRILSKLEAPVIFEFGAYDGAVTAKLCRFLTAPLSAYYVWEPDPRNIQRIKQRGLPAGVVLVEAAVGSRDGRATLHLSGGAPPGQQVEFTYGSSLSKPTDENAFWFPWMRFQEEVEVQVFSLDGFCRQHHVDRVDFLWADIQGAEKDLILGGAETLKRTRFMFLEQEGYRLYEDQWLFRDMMEALRPDWKLACRFPSDVLLYNSALVPKPDCS